MTRVVFRIEEHGGEHCVKTILVTLSESKAWQCLTQYTPDDVKRTAWADMLDSDPHQYRWYCDVEKFKEDWL